MLKNYFNKHINIEQKIIGEGKPVYIIAEAGSNHNGELEQAKKLVDIASEAKADAIKFQLFKSELLLRKKEEIKTTSYLTF